MILKVVKIWANLGLNYSFALKGNFCGKLTTITLDYLVSPIMLLRFKQIFRVNHKISGYISLVQIDSKLSICPKRDFFGKIECYYCLPTVFFHTTEFQKIPQRENQGTEGWIILDQIRCDLLAQKGIFWSSLPTLL